jgi:hypothetical protein
MRLVAELTPVLIPILYAVEARDRALNAIRQVCARQTIASPHPMPPGGRRPASRNRGRRRDLRKTVVPTIAAILLLLMIGGAIYLRIRPHPTAVAPLADPQAGMPLIAYTTPAAISIRHGDGPPRTIATIDGTVSDLVWSADSRHLAWLSTPQNGSASVNVADPEGKAPVLSWTCDHGCAGLAFLGDRLISSTLPASPDENAPEIESYPIAAGTRPSAFSVVGLPAPSPYGERVVQVFGSIPHDTGVLVYWADIGANGRPVRQVYRVDEQGTATPLGSTGVDRPFLDVTPEVAVTSAATRPRASPSWTSAIRPPPRSAFPATGPGPGASSPPGSTTATPSTPPRTPSPETVQEEEPWRPRRSPCGQACCVWTGHDGSTPVSRVYRDGAPPKDGW